MDVREIPQDFEITVVDRPLDHSFDREIEAIWEKEGCFDGKILTALEVNQTGLTGAFIPYRYFLASERSAEIKSALNIQAVAVTGMTRNKGGQWLLGQRSENVTQYPGYWELAPSGGIDEASMSQGEVDFKEQLLRELKEETGIDKVGCVVPKFLIQDQVSGMWELCLEVVVTKEPELSSREYQKLLWVDKENLPSGERVPLTRILLDRILS